MATTAQHTSMESAFRRQAEACGRLGSPLYADVLGHMADSVARGGVVWDIVGDYDGDPVADTMPLRLARGIHHDVLVGEAAPVARHYPSVGGTPDPATLWADVAAYLREPGVAERMRAGLLHPVQTNEVKRTSVLLGGYALLGGEFPGMAVRVLEIGASAGLNLRWDDYRYELSAERWGHVDAPAVVRAEWTGTPPSLATVPKVVSRRGCDLHPGDVCSAEGRAWMLAQIWPDQPARIELLRAALEAACDDPAPVDRAPAEAWLPAQLATPYSGVLTVVQHTAMWHLVPAPARDAIDAAIEEAGTRATASAPLARISMEWPGSGEFPVKLTVWPGGEPRQIAVSDAHGNHTRWLQLPASP